MEYDHEEVRCEEMEDWDMANKQPGERRTCCICKGHDCDAARMEIAAKSTSVIER